MRRRRLLQLLAAGAGLPALARSGLQPAAQALAAAPRPVPSVPLDAAAEATLRALAETVLPSSLGRERTAEVTRRFLAWLRGYQSGAETDHGYGATRIVATGASPATAYPAQLAALERQARRRAGSFAAADPDLRRRLTESALRKARVEALPERPDGRHVAADLMSFFFLSAEAADLCYGAAIGRDTCRGLPGSEERPEKRDES